MNVTEPVSRDFDTLRIQCDTMPFVFSCLYDIVNIVIIARLNNSSSRSCGTLSVQYYVLKVISYEHIGGLAHLEANPVKGSCCFIEQDTLPSLLSTGWFQERI